MAIDPQEIKPGDAPLQANIARTVGFHALRKMSRMAQDIEAEEKNKLRWARNLGLTLAAFALAALLLILLAPELLRGMLRGVTSLFR